MRINEINRNAQSHGAYTATVQLKYDEAVFLQNAVHEYRKVHELNERQEFFCTEIFIMSELLQHGALDKFALDCIVGNREEQKNEQI